VCRNEVSLRASREGDERQERIPKDKQNARMDGKSKREGWNFKKVGEGGREDKDLNLVTQREKVNEGKSRKKKKGKRGSVLP
jgi:hypothetical protein